MLGAQCKRKVANGLKRKGGVRESGGFVFCLTFQIQLTAEPVSKQAHASQMQPIRSNSASLGAKGQGVVKGTEPVKPPPGNGLFPRENEAASHFLRFWTSSFVGGPFCNGKYKAWLPFLWPIPLGFHSEVRLPAVRS